MKIFKLFLIVFSFVFFLIGFFFLYYGKDLPRPEEFSEIEIPLSSKIYDRTGKILLYELYFKIKREYLPLEKIPSHLRNAIIVAEDKNFYHHFGLDLKAILRAFFLNLKKRKFLYGGSTISQQLIRISYLTREKTIARKIKEIILTLELERKYSKDQILEWYLNQVPFGANAFGVEAAAQTYFRKSAQKLNLSESAILASMIKAPSYYSPWKKNKERLLKRKNYLLREMERLGYINEKERKKAEKEKVEFASSPVPLKAPHFSLYVKEILLKKFSKEKLEKGGLKIITSLNWEFQKEAEKVVKTLSKKNEKYQAYNAALVAIDPRNGDVLALVGSRDWFSKPFPLGCKEGKDCFIDPKVNSVFSLRQPGSALKPFVYAKAFEMGYLPTTILWDVKTEFNPNCSAEGTEERDRFGNPCYHPENYNKKYQGPVSLKEGLAQSINTVSVKLLYLVGLEEVLKFLKKVGIESLTQKERYGLSLVLGGGEVKLIELASAYGIFAQRGVKVKPRFILKVIDPSGRVIFENKIKKENVLNPQIADMINDILSDNLARAPMFGYFSPLYFKNYQVAAKTGTSQDFRDAWTIGWTPNIICGVWVGNNNNLPMEKKPGVFLASPIFHQFFEKILPQREREEFIKPLIKPTGKMSIDGFLKKPYHSILYYIDRENPKGEKPKDPQKDPLFENFEKAILIWLKTNKI